MPKNQTSFKPGNKFGKGRPKKGYSITEMMKEMLKAHPEKREKLGEVIYQKALEGDMTAMTKLWNYMDGMPMQPIKHGGDSENPLKVEYIE